MNMLSGRPFVLEPVFTEMYRTRIAGHCGGQFQGLRDAAADDAHTDRQRIARLGEHAQAAAGLHSGT